MVIKLNAKTCRVFVAGIIFAAIFIVGVFGAQNKSLWKDEHYSLLHSLVPVSYGQIINGKGIVEANNSPFFYLLQKVVIDFARYDPRVLKQQPLKDVHVVDVAKWKWQFNRYNQGSDVVGDPYSNLLLRLVPLTFMAFIPAVFFYYFASRFSLWTGILSVFLTFSSWMFWWYGLEMRPYIYIYALTAVQFLLLMEIARVDQDRPCLWRLLGGVHLLLALTYSAAMLQIVAAFLYLVAFWRKGLHWKRWVYLWVIPFFLIVYYYTKATHFPFYMPKILGGSFSNTLSNEAFVVLWMLLIFLITGFFLRSQDRDRVGFIQWPKKDILKRVMGYWALIFFTVGLYFLLLVFFKMISRPIAPGVFYFAFRYFIALVPVGIILMVLAAYYLMRGLVPLWGKCIFAIMMFSLVGWRLWMTMNRVWVWIGF